VKLKVFYLLKDGSMVKTRIHIIEDNKAILELMSFILTQEGYQITSSETGEAGIVATLRDIPDLVILDLGLPDISGEQVYKCLKGNSKLKKLSVVIVSAHANELDIVNGLNWGVDDYITKPFNYNIFLARVNAVMKRQRKGSPTRQIKEKLVFGELEIDPLNYTVSLEGKEVRLTHNEFKIISYLASHPSWVFSRQQLIDATSGEDHYINERTIDVQISSLRKKLLTHGKLISTVRGVGYRFEAVF